MRKGKSFDEQREVVETTRRRIRIIYIYENPPLLFFYWFSEPEGKASSSRYPQPCAVGVSGISRHSYLVEMSLYEFLGTNIYLLTYLDSRPEIKPSQVKPHWCISTVQCTKPSRQHPAAQHARVETILTHPSSPSSIVIRHVYLAPMSSCRHMGR